MILSGPEILEEMGNDNIIIEPFNIEQLNPNSYNLKLADELMVYDVYHCIDQYHLNDTDHNVYFNSTNNNPLDMKKNNPVKTIKIPETGLTLYPGILYLGRTVERTETHKFLPCLEGRSSIGRLGMTVHVTAGFGDVGFNGTWTLEISVVEPVTIYPFIEVCQIYYQEVKGDISEYNGRYQNQKDIEASRLWIDTDNM